MEIMEEGLRDQHHEEREISTLLGKMKDMAEGREPGVTGI